VKQSLKWYYSRVRAWISRPRMIVQQRTLLVDSIERCASPLFIVGAHRSGTSLVRRMFNSHPDIACPPESFFMANYVAMLEDQEIFSGYRAFGHDPEAMRADLARKASDLHEGFRIAHGKSLWADKTPQYTAILDGIDRLFARTPRYVLVLRHPLDIVYSNFQKGWKHNTIEDPFESNLAYVRQSIDRLLAFEAQHPARCTRIVYRQLCDDPATVLAAAMAKIGLEYHPDMLEFGSKNHNFGAEDPIARSRKVIEVSEGAWHSLSPAQKQRAAEVFGPEVLAERFWD
jgi:Sulfotransferase family